MFHRFTRFDGRLIATAAAVFMAFAAPAAHADTIVLPNGAEDASVSGLSTPFRSAPRAYMVYLDESQFTSITSPVLITGMQFRLAIGANNGVTGNWPSQNLTFSQYDIQMSRASALLATDGEFLSSTGAFSSYQDATNLTTVRSGALTIPAGSFPQDGGATGVHSFGPLISFSTPYLYTPGQTLTYLIRLSGYTPGAEPQPFFASADYAPNSQDAISSTVSASAANSNGFSSPAIVQFQYSAVVAVPEPSTLALLLPGVGALLGGVLVRRKRAAK